MKAELIQYMGTDLTVVNAARVSFDKESDWDYKPHSGFAVQNGDHVKLGERDQKLLNYLSKHNHWTPFSHVMITMRETVPIFVARQRFKHMVGFTYNEVSRRYVSDEPSFYEPNYWREAAENKKQGSTDEVHMHSEYYMNYMDRVNELALQCYTDMIKDGVAPEQARMVLPQSMMTSYYVTGSLAAWARAYKLRSEETAQQEIRNLAIQWGDIIGGIKELQYSWNALTSTS